MFVMIIMLYVVILSIFAVIAANEGWGLGRRCLPPQPTRGSGEASWAPSARSGRSPGRHRIFGIFEVHRTLLVERTVPTKPVVSVKKSTQSTMGGMSPPLWIRFCFKKDAEYLLALLAKLEPRSSHTVSLR